MTHTTTAPTAQFFGNRSLIESLGWDEKRGTWGMLYFILTEAMLFLCLFFAYFYLGRDQPRWPIDEPPKLALALTMLVVLVASSVLLQWGEFEGRKGRSGRARGAIAGTIFLGLCFVGLQVLEYRDHLKKLLPTTDSYGSIFYTITSFHGAHILLGLSMLSYVLVLPKIHGREKSPYRPLHNASLYWHFVDAMWVIIVALLYILPHLYRG